MTRRPDARRQGFAWLETLWATIADRAATRPAGSYTTTLLDGGVDAAGRKVTEEATEVLIAAKDDAAAEAAGPTATRPARPSRRGRRPAVSHPRAAGRARSRTGRVIDGAPRSSSTLRSGAVRPGTAPERGLPSGASDLAATSCRSGRRTTPRRSARDEPPGRRPVRR